MARQLVLLKQPGVAEHFVRAIEKLREKRQGFLVHSQTRLVSPDGAPAGAA
jgi:hypothetical protein